MENMIFEIKRKLVHLTSIIYVIIYCLIKEFFSQPAAILILVFILICLSILEFLKMKFDRKIPFFHQLYRENEKNTISGCIYLVIGMIIAFSVFEFSIALTAVLMMIFGDTASAIIGRLGNHKIDHIKRTWEGVISELLVDLIIGFIFLNNIVIILFMAIIATVTETLLKPIDDNLAIPVVAGFVGQILMILLNHL
jgi:phytol kinase